MREQEPFSHQYGFTQRGSRRWTSGALNYFRGSCVVSSAAGHL